MATRTADLYPAATEVANRLTKRMGNQKLVLSAGVIALSKLEPHDRDAICEEALDEKAKSVALNGASRTLQQLSVDLPVLLEYMSRDQDDWGGIRYVKAILDVIRSGVNREWDHIPSVFSLLDIQPVADAVTDSPRQVTPAPRDSDAAAPLVESPVDAAVTRRRDSRSTKKDKSSGVG